MKKFLLLFLALIVIVVMIVNLPSFEVKKDISLKNNKDNSSLSIMLQDENGKYQEENNSFNKEGYRFNKKLSKCVNDSKISFSDGNLIIKGNRSDRCYAYFDNVNFIEDLSGNGNHGKNKGALWSNDGWVSGDEEKYYGYIDCGLAEFDFKTSVSLIVRAKFNKFINNEAMFGNWQKAGFGIYLFNNQFGFNLMTGLDNNYVELKSDIKILDNNWHIFIGTYDGNTINLYIDGEKVKSQMVDASNIEVSISPLGLGGDIEGSIVSNPSYATYSEALVFNRALSSEEVIQNYASKINPTNKANLLLWYKFA